MSLMPPQDLKEKDLQPYYQKIIQQADKITSGFLIGFFVLGILLAFFYDTFGLAFLMGGTSLGLFLVVRTMFPHTLLVRMLGSLLFWNFGVQFLFQLHGLDEIKFLFFITLTILLFYEDWRVFIPATIYAIVTLVLLFLFRESTFIKENLTDMKNITLTSSLIQVVAILFYSALCIWWATIQHGQTKDSANAAVDMEKQLGMVDVNIAFADSISQGNLKAQYSADNPDKLGFSLINMRDSLLHAAEREDREKFKTTGLAVIGDILRIHAENLEMLCDNVIEEVVKYMKANQGSIFVVENQGTKDEHYRLMAARAWNRKKYLQKKIVPGEGLVGQSAIEKQRIFLTKVPENYVSISSGLGEANPRSVLIVPLKSDDVVVGVIEIASFKVYEEYEIQFLEKLGESIAATIVTTRNNQKNKELLEKSNLLAEQMRAQEEEMRQNLEEMQATQEEMHRKNKEIERLLAEADQKELQLQRQLEEIQAIKKTSDEKNAEMIQFMESYKRTLLNILDQLPHKVFLKDATGKMVLVNTAVAKAHHLSVEELIGKSDFDFVDAATAQEWRNQELEIIKKGSETYIFEDKIGGESHTLKSTKMAFFIPHLNEQGLLGIQTDITEIEALKKRIHELSKVS